MMKESKKNTTKKSFKPKKYVILINKLKIQQILLNNLVNSSLWVWELNKLCVLIEFIQY